MQEEASAEQLIQVAVEIARRSIHGPSKPLVDLETPPKVSNQDRALARAIELAGGKIRSEDENSLLF